MEVKIYQINTDRDKNSVKFLQYGNLEKYQNTKDINALIYDEVFSGNVDCEDLEDIFRKFNTCLIRKPNTSILKHQSASGKSKLQKFR